MEKGFGDGSKLFQQRAKLALPLLVGRAKAGRSVTYGQLAHEMRMPNPRNLNYVLGAVGRELRALGRRWKERIPAISCLVINKTKHTPGKGIGFHMRYEKFQKQTPLVKKQVLRDLNRDIFGYQKWDDVLRHFRIKAVIPANRMEAIATKAGHGGGGGETEDHRRLKSYIAEWPKVVGLPNKPIGQLEYKFLSTDQIDILFRYSSHWVGVEVKAGNSDEADMMRGIFQCVKYQALIEAVQRYEQETVDSRVVLALGGELPRLLADLADLLEVEVWQRIAVPASFRPAKST